MKYSKTGKFVNLCVYGLILYAMQIGQTYAAVPLVYPAANCVQEGTSGKFDIDSFGYIQNLSTTGTLNIICPTSFDHGGNIDSAFAQVVANHSSIYVRCTLRVIYLPDSGSGTFTSQTRRALNTGITTLRYTRQSTINNSSHVIMSCSIPPREVGAHASGLNTYSVDP